MPKLVLENIVKNLQRYGTEEFEDTNLFVELEKFSETELVEMIIEAIDTTANVKIFVVDS